LSCGFIWGTRGYFGNLSGQGEFYEFLLDLLVDDHVSGCMIGSRSLSHIIGASFIFIHLSPGDISADILVVSFLSNSPLSAFSAGLGPIFSGFSTLVIVILRFSIAFPSSFLGCNTGPCSVTSVSAR
jgi:hypothetical protein